MSAIVKKALEAVSKVYVKHQASRIAAFGLKYDDLLIETDAMRKALSRTDGTTTLERERRIKRAFDLNAKRKEIDSAHSPVDPMDRYLAGKEDIALLEEQERKILNNY